MEVRVSVSDAQSALEDYCAYAYQTVLYLLMHVHKLTGLLDMIQLNFPYCCHQHAIQTL